MKPDLRHFCVFALVLIIICSNTYAQEPSIAGLWQTIDDKSGKVRSIVKISINKGQLSGHIVKLYLKADEEPNPLCDKCDSDDRRYQQEIIGLEILNGLTKNTKKNTWEGGEILDPENGKVYRSTLWLDKGKLNVRGYILFLYRTQQWVRYKGAL
jgi:uncharacterized protein (DUF2147 family)